jgi:flagellar motility protein MotE (MotC chaperone)
MQINKLLEYAAYAVGGVSLFLASLLVFALAAGVPAHDVALVGGFFPEPPAPQGTSNKEPGSEPARPKIQAKSLEDVVASTLGRLPGQTVTSPFDDSELETLVGDLKRLKLQYERELESVTKRGAEISEREASLDERAGLLQDLMAQLDQREGELALREEEVQRDESVAEENDAARWVKIAKVFAEGDATKMAGRLKLYGPEDGARILSNLEEDQRKALLDALPDSDFLEFNNAYSALSN